MTADQYKRALKLYDRFKCDTMAYEDLAKEFGMRVTELNEYCWGYRKDHPKKSRARK